MSDASPGQLTRQQLYERIRQSSRDEVILEEMIRLGFWPAEQSVPSVPAEIIRRQGELERELQELFATQRKFQDPAQALKELRKQRLAEARKKRQETKERQARERVQRAQAWQARKHAEILYLGAGVSGGLNHTDTDRERLAAQGLPLLNNAAEIAEAMGITLGELRFLAFARKTARISHYRCFDIPKKTGGTRRISVPMPRLKRAQYWILENILIRGALHGAAHGFRVGHSIVSNARPHVGMEVVVNLDLKDFFPTITYPRVKGLFRGLGYAEQAATVLGLLCSEPAVDEVELDGETWFIGRGPRHLPQGAPTSPAISNLLCRHLDARLAGMATTLGFRYTRYADDLSFSGPAETVPRIGKLLWRTGQIVTAEGFTVHAQKQRIMRRSQRQEVTGIVVNQKPAINRATLRRFRATLHQLEKDGPQGKHWGKSDDVMAAVQGFAHYVAMVDPAKGKPLVKQVRSIRARLGHPPARETPEPLPKVDLRHQAAVGEPTRTDGRQPREDERSPLTAQTPVAVSEAKEASAPAPETSEIVPQAPEVSGKTSPLLRWLRWIIVLLVIWLVFRLLR